MIIMITFLKLLHFTFFIVYMLFTTFIILKFYKFKSSTNVSLVIKVFIKLLKKTGLTNYKIVQNRFFDFFIEFSLIFGLDKKNF